MCVQVYKCGFAAPANRSLQAGRLVTFVNSRSLDCFNLFTSHPAIEFPKYICI